MKPLNTPSQIPLSTLLVFALLTGCGGGGGSGPDSAAKEAPSSQLPVSQPPVGQSPIAQSPAVPSLGTPTLSSPALSASTFIGQEIATTDFHGTAPDTTAAFGPIISVIGDGVELTEALAGGFATIDFTATTIRITAATDQPFGYFELLRFFDVNGTIGPFVSAALDPATDYAGIDSSRIFVAPQYIEVNLTGLTGKRGQQLLLNVTVGAQAPVSGWTQIASEGQEFSVSGTQTVRYGSGSIWITQSVTDGGVCTNEFFGTEPLVGVVKQCEVAASVSTAWTQIASEGEEFSVSGTQTVRYGSGSNWITQNVTDGGACTNEFFGTDPLFGVLKVCEIASATTLAAGP